MPASAGPSAWSTAHPWTNGRVERLNRPIKEATVQRYHYQTTDELSEHLQAFLLAYNHAKRLKTLRGLTPHEVVCAQWQKNPLSLPVTRPTSPWDYTLSCVSCVEEFPALNALVDRYRQNPQVLILSLALNHAQQLRPFLQEHPVKFAVIPTTKAYLSDTLSVFEYPTHFILGPDSRILRGSRGNQSLCLGKWPLANRRSIR